jgi:hypothetical protein
MTKKKILIILFSFLVLAFLIISILNNQTSSPAEQHFITSNPLDLSQIESISSFRSCVGHDYSPSEEKLRSMKHYITSNQELENTSELIKTFSPFDGTITTIDPDRGPENASRGEQIWLEPNAAQNWYFLFFHVNLIDGLSEGSKVQSGQLIGYADTQNAANFDIGVKGSTPIKGPNIYTSPFNHMVEDVFIQYSELGITKNNIILTKEFRDANPCLIIPGTESKHDTEFAHEDQGERPWDWVHLIPPPSPR